MSADFSDYVHITRTFRDLSDADIADIEKASALVRFGWEGGFGWDEVLRSARVLLISEAGVGKTRECQAQKDRLLAAGESAFFFDLATLAATDLRDTLLSDDEARFEAWRASSETATFFLDSIDELKLTLGNFEVALTRVAKALAGQLARARIVVTTRPVPFDRQLIERYLPIPAPAEAARTAEAFADMVMERGVKAQTDDNGKGVKPWRNVGLMPLSQEQRRLFASAQGIADPDSFLEDIRLRDAEEFAERPQDLIELCADWRDHHRIGSHRDQVGADIATKLKPRTDRAERAELTQDAAFDGASRLALAAMLTRKLTLRHNAESDRVAASEPALDVSKILLNWDAAAQATLLERPLFGFASYGRVRFHHRSVVEFLAAKRLDALLARGASIKAIKRLLLTETAQGLRVVRPSMRPAAAWLASWHATIFDDLVRLDPAVALDHGDPQGLSISQRAWALEAYVDRYGVGGWRGLQTPSIQVHRFAAPELADTVAGLWARGIENGEVRELLLRLIAAGKLAGCADIAFAVAMQGDAVLYERILAIGALLRLNDARLDVVSNSIESDAERWEPDVARRAMLELFPARMPVDLVASILRQVPDDGGRTLGDYDYRLRQAIAHSAIVPTYLDALRQALSDIVADGLTWTDRVYPHLQTARADLLPALAAACLRQSSEGVRTESWMQSTLLAVRLSNRDYGDERPLEQLRLTLGDLPAAAREAAFWHEAALLESLHPFKDAWSRLFELTHDRGISLDAKDAVWVRRRLADPAEPLQNREMMLWAEMQMLPHEEALYRAQLGSLKPFVADAPALLAILEERLKPREEDSQLRNWEVQSADRKKEEERRQAEAHASWAAFWQEIDRDPEAVFHPDRVDNTAWNLWRAVERAGKESRVAGWNRQLIERQFGKPVADRLRETMKAAWRKDTPTLPSERPEGKKSTFLIRWQFGLAGIMAEAEDPTWATHLTAGEAELACRYVPIHINGFPPWLESLAVQHPGAVDRVLGEELSASLREIDGSGGHAIGLQDVSYAPATLAALFVPRIRSWLAEFGADGRISNNPHAAHHLRQAIDILVKSGTDDDRRFVEAEAARRLNADDPCRDEWLAAVLRLNPAAGVEALEHRLQLAEVEKVGPGARLLAGLFGRDQGPSINVGSAGFTPTLVLRLVRLAYLHIRTADDEHHQGGYTPDTRDYAEQARNALLGALFDASGPEGWRVKLELAADPLVAHLKDRTLAVAAEKAAEEADRTALTEAEFIVLDKSGEAPPSTRDAMFELLRDRLDDLDDLLLQDVSPREAWAGITDERVMRRELARALRQSSSGAYTVDQEAVTADEKETDIRLRSTVSSQQATIELKLGDERSGRDLYDTLRNQLLTKYMAADDCRAGCLLITVARDREWEHPVTRQRIGLDELNQLLNDEAGAIARELSGAARLMAKVLDLRPRLGPN